MSTHLLIDSTLKTSVASIFQETLISALEGIGGLGEIKYSLSILTQKINNFRKTGKYSDILNIHTIS